MRVGALLRGLLGACQVEGSVDQGNVREGLREVALQTTLVRFVFFRQQAEIVTNRQQPGEEFFRVGLAADRDIGVGEPETAGEKRAFARRQPSFSSCVL